MGLFSKIIDALVGSAKPGKRFRQAERQAKRLGIDVEAERQKRRLSTAGQEERRRRDPSRIDAEGRSREERAERIKRQDQALYSFLYAGQLLLTPESSNVGSMRYYADRRILEVAYHGNFRHPLWHYWYMNVSPEEATGFYRAMSKGKWVWDHLRIRKTKLGHKKVYSFMGGGGNPTGWMDGELQPVLPGGDAIEPQWVQQARLNPGYAEEWAEMGTAQSAAAGYVVIEDPITGKKFMKKQF